jgi:bifunctional non-homologous end joining protein LigD
MPLKLHREPFSKPEYLYEIKHDGFRALAFVRDGACRLVSRYGNVFKSFSILNAAIPEQLNATAVVLNGEIVCLDEQGRSQFNELSGSSSA